MSMASGLALMVLAIWWLALTVCVCADLLQAYFFHKFGWFKTAEEMRQKIEASESEESPPEFEDASQPHPSVFRVALARTTMLLSSFLFLPVIVIGLLPGLLRRQKERLEHLVKLNDVKAVLTTIAVACGVVCLLFLGHVAMTYRLQFLSTMAQADAKKIAIPSTSVFTNVNVSTSSPGRWYGGGRIEININGTVATTNDMATLVAIVQKQNVAFPVSWEVRLDGEDVSAVFDRPDMRRKARWNQLSSNLAARLLMFWGLSPLLFPAILVLCLAYARAPTARRLLHGGLFSWGLWLLLFDRVNSGFWYWPSFIEHFGFVAFVTAAWAFVTQIRCPPDMTGRLRLLIPCAIPILADAIYAPLNSGYLVDRYGCGCRLDDFNTNNITFSFAIMVWGVSLGSAVLASHGKRLWLRVLHFIISGTVTFWLSRQLIWWNIWL